MNFRTLAASVLLGASLSVSAHAGPIGPVPPVGSYIQNQSAPQSAQFNVTNGTVRDTLTASTISVVFLIVPGTVTANGFVGSGTGLTHLNAAAADVGVLPSSALSGSYTGITGVGTLTAGAWRGSPVGTKYGGLGSDLSSVPTGYMLVFTSTGVIGTLAPGTSGSILQSTGTTVMWVTAPSVLGTHVIDIPLSNLLSGNLSTAVAVNDASISTVSAAKVIGNISGEASGLYNPLPLGDLAGGTLSTTIVASSVANSGVTAGRYGDAFTVPRFRVESDGRISSMTLVAIAASTSTDHHVTTITFTEANQNIIFPTKLNLISQSGFGDSIFTVSTNGVSTNRVFEGNGSLLTHIPASSVDAGALGSGVRASSITVASMHGSPTIDGTNFTGLPGNRITGSVPSGVLPSTIAYTGKLNTFTSTQTFTSTVAVSGGDFTVGGSTLVAHGGRVGIGVSTPTHTLEVNGQTATNSLCLAGNCRSSWPGGGGGDTYLASTQTFTGLNTFQGHTEMVSSATVHDDLGVTGTVSAALFSGSGLSLNNVPADSINPGSLGGSVIASSIAATTPLPWSQVTGVPTLGDVHLTSTQTFTGQNTFSNKVFVDSDVYVGGNVGIGGDAIPQYSLFVVGKANADELCIGGICKDSWPLSAGLASTQTWTGQNTYKSSTTFDGLVLITSGPLTVQMTGSSELGSVINALVNSPGPGSAGIGVIAKSNSVNAVVEYDTTTTRHGDAPVISGYSPSLAAAFIQTANGLGTSTTGFVILTSNAHVGIGTTSPFAPLHVRGGNSDGFQLVIQSTSSDGAQVDGGILGLIAPDVGMDTRQFQFRIASGTYTSHTNKIELSFAKDTLFFRDHNLQDFAAIGSDSSGEYGRVGFLALVSTGPDGTNMIQLSTGTDQSQEVVRINGGVNHGFSIDVLPNSNDERGKDAIVVNANDSNDGLGWVGMHTYQIAAPLHVKNGNEDGFNQVLESTTAANTITGGGLLGILPGGQNATFVIGASTMTGYNGKNIGSALDKFLAAFQIEEYSGGARASILVGASTYVLVADRTSKFIGIGTQNPQSKLHVVDGDVRLSTTTGDRGIYFQDGTFQNTAATGGGATVTSSSTIIADGTTGSSGFRVCVATVQVSGQKVTVSLAASLAGTGGFVDSAQFGYLVDGVDSGLGIHQYTLGGGGGDEFNISFTDTKDGLADTSHSVCLTYYAANNRSALTTPFNGAHAKWSAIGYSQ